MSDPQLAQDVAKAIPGMVVMISGCQDAQTSADVSNTASFGLPSNSGPGGAGGACTSSMMKALHEKGGYTWATLLGRMREILKGKYTQIPMLSSSRGLDLQTPFSLQNAQPNGRHRAVLVGINYVGSKAELKGCHNDVETMKRHLLTQGYTEEDMQILLDDGAHNVPSKANMLAAFSWLVTGAGPGDSLFFHYSGHGASVKDDNGDEKDGMDEALCPSDYSTAGFITDDRLFEQLILPLKEGVTLACILDCCHSGTILDLPYMFVADEVGMQAVNHGQTTMQQNPTFNFGKVLEIIKKNPGMAAGAAAVTGLAYALGGQQKGQAVQKMAMEVLGAENKQAALMNAAKQGSTMCALL